MARRARFKLDNAVYHIYQHGIYEINLFKDNQDKEYYLYLLKKYKSIYKVRIFAYCIMDTHFHILMNPNCADISKVMHSINQCYAQYYNKKYNRKGHVFSSRFCSNIAEDNRAILIMSAYIHNNPKDIANYSSNVEEYPYSSLGIYSNKFSDKFKIIEQEFLLNYYYQGNDFYRNINKSKEVYYQFVKRLSVNYDANISCDKMLSDHISVPNTKCSNLFDIDSFINIKRDINPSNIINKLSKQPCFKKMDTTYKAICILVIRCLSNTSYYDMAKYFNDLSPSYLSRLCNKAYDLVSNDITYKRVFDNFLY